MGRTSIASANAKKNKEGLIFQPKAIFSRGTGSVFAWLGCFSQRSKQVSSLGGQILQSKLPEPHASFATQLLLGKQSQSSKSLQHLFKVTGMSHVLVISGFHLQLLASLCLASITKVATKNQAAVFVLVAVWLYVSMLEISIPITRALLMLTVGLTAKILNRPYSSKQTLIAVALVLWLFDRSILSSLSFQLSFAATASILWVYPLFTGIASNIEHFRPQSWQKNLLETWLLGVVISVFLSPLLSYHFGSFSLVSMIISPLFSMSLPLVVCLLGLLLLFAAAGSEVLSLMVVGVISTVLDVLFTGLRVLAAVSWLQVEWQLDSNSIIFGWYGAVVISVALVQLLKIKRLINRSKMIELCV